MTRLPTSSYLDHGKNHGLQPFQIQARNLVDNRNRSPDTGTEGFLGDFLRPIWTNVPDTKIVWGDGPKQNPRAQEKINEGGGDPNSLTDLWRATIFVTTEVNLLSIYQAIKDKTVGGAGMHQKEGTTYCKSAKLRGVRNDGAGSNSDTMCSHPDFTDDASGYSGGNIVLILKNNQPAEVQINTRNMMYGKHGSIEGVNGGAIKTQYKVTGGLGHIFYEMIRAPVKNQTEVIELSKKYYKHLRNPNPAKSSHDAKGGPKTTAQELEDKIQKFIKDDRNANWFLDLKKT